MAFDSTIRLRQLNNPEVSGYTVAIIKQYLTTGTGVNVSSTGILTGTFYPLKSNPSGYVTGSVVRPGDTGNLADQNYISVVQNNILAQISGQYYLLNNPSGFLTRTSGDQLYLRFSNPNTGQLILEDSVNSNYSLDFNPNKWFFIRGTGGAEIDLYNTNSGYVSGLRLYSNDIKLAGKTVLNDTGKFINTDVGATNTRLYLQDPIKGIFPFGFSKGSEFILSGINDSIIDLYDSRRDYSSPLISGFEIDATSLKINGVGLNTGSGTVTYAQLTGVSGSLQYNIDLVQSEVDNLALRVGVPSGRPLTIYLNKNPQYYLDKGLTSYSTIQEVLNYIVSSGSGLYKVVAGTGNYGTGTVTGINGTTPGNRYSFGEITYFNEFNSSTYSPRFRTIFQNCDGRIRLNDCVYATISCTTGLISIDSNSVFPKDVEDITTISLVGITGALNGLRADLSIGGACNLDINSCQIPTMILAGNAMTGLRFFDSELNAIGSLGGAVWQPTRYKIRNSIANKTHSLDGPSNGINLTFSGSNLSTGGNAALIAMPSGWGGLAFDKRNLRLITNLTGAPSGDLILTKVSGDNLYYSSSNPSDFASKNYIAATYAPITTAVVNTVSSTSNNSLYLYDSSKSQHSHIFNSNLGTYYLTSTGNKGYIDIYGSTNTGSPIISGFALTGITTIDVKDFYISGLPIGPFLSSNGNLNDTVKITGSQTISGNKIFADTITFNSTINTSSISNSSNNVVDVNNAQLEDSSSAISVDWGNRILSGNWKIQSLTVSGQPTVTTGQTGNFIDNGMTGSLILTGAGGITITSSGNTVTISGQITGNSSNTGELTGVFYPLVTNPSGYITGLNTGSFATTGYVSGISGVLDIRLNSTGSTLLSLIESSSAGVSTLNGKSGFLNLTGAGNVVITSSGQIITISGAGTSGQDLSSGKLYQKYLYIEYPTSSEDISWFYNKENITLSSIVSVVKGTGASVGWTLTQSSGRNLQGSLIVSGITNSTTTGNLINTFTNSTLSGENFILFKTQTTGGVIRDFSLTLIGQPITLLASGTGDFVTRSETGSFITTGQTGAFGGNTGSLTGAFYPLLSNPSGYVTGLVVRPNETGGFIISSQTGILTGEFYPLRSNPSGYITGINTGFIGEEYIARYDQRPVSIPGLIFGGHQGEDAYPIWGNFLTNALTNWTKRGGTFNLSLTGNISGYTNPEYSIGPLFSNQSYLDFSTINRSNTGILVAEFTGLSFDVPSHAVWAPFLTTRLTSQTSAITGIKVDYLDSSNNWTTIVSGAPTFTGVVWGGPYVILTGFPLKGVKFTLDIASGVSTLNIGEFGITNKNYIKGTNLYAFQYSSPIFNIISGSGIKVSGTNVVLATQTGQFYPRSGNLSGFITTGQTGIFISTGHTGQFLGTGNPTKDVFFRDISGRSLSIQRGIQLNNNQGISGKLTNGTNVNLLFFNNSNETLLGTNNEVKIALNGDVYFQPPAGGNVNIFSSGGGAITMSGPTTLSGKTIITNGETGNLVDRGMTGNFIHTSQTGDFVGHGETGALLTEFVSHTETGFLSGIFYPYSSNPSNYLLSSQTGEFTTTGYVSGVSGTLNTRLESTGSYLYTLIQASSAGVSSINSSSGSLTLDGAGNVSILTNGQTITVSGETGILSNQFVLIDEQRQVNIPGLMFAGNQSENSYPIWGGFLSNALTNWVRRGGTLNVSFTGEVSGLSSPEIMVQPYFTNNTWREITNLNRSNTGVVVIEFTGLSFDVPSHAAWAPFLTTRLSSQITDITGIKVEYLDNSNNWNAIFSGSPTYTGALWGGPYTVLTGYPLKGVKFSLNIASGSSTISFSELGIWNKNYVKGSNLIAFEYDSPTFNLITATGITSLSGSIGGYEIITTNDTGNFITNNQTGQFATTGYVSGISGVLSDRLNSTGSFLYDLVQASSAGVSSINNKSGSLIFTGAGNVNISITGQTITFSGNTGSYASFALKTETGSFITSGQTGLLTGSFYPLKTNPSGYLTGFNSGLYTLNASTGGFVTTGQTGLFYTRDNPSGFINISIADGRYLLYGETASANNAVGFINSTKNDYSFRFEGFAASQSVHQYYLKNSFNSGVIDIGGNLIGSGFPTISGFNITGNFISASGITLNGFSVVATNHTGNFIDLEMTGRYTGEFYPRYLNPSGYITGVNTGNFITSSQTGQFVPSGLTGLLLVAKTQTGSFISTGMTGSFISTGMTGRFVDIGMTGNYSGQFYPRFSNPSGYINSTQTGSFVDTGKTGQLTLTGAGNIYITSSGNVVTISGDISNYVTSSQTGDFVGHGETGVLLTEFVSHFETGILTGSFYPLRSNPSGYITGLDTGSFITTSQTGVFALASQSGTNKISSLATSSLVLSSAATGNNWYRIATTAPGNYRFSSFLEIATQGGSAAPSSRLFFLSHDWTTIGTISFIHNTSNSNAFKGLRLVRNTGTVQTYVDVFAFAGFNSGDTKISVVNFDGLPNYLRATWSGANSGTESLGTNEVLSCQVECDANVISSHSNSSLSSGNFHVNFASGIQGRRFVANIANGTAPLTVVSQTLCPNLNADLLDSQEGSYYLTVSNHLGTGAFYPRSGNVSGFVTGSVIRPTDLVVFRTGTQSISGNKTFNDTATFLQNLSAPGISNSSNNSIDVNTAVINDSSSTLSIDWGNRNLSTAAAQTSLAWEKRILSGNWLCGNLSGTGAGRFNTLFVNGVQITGNGAGGAGVTGFINLGSGSGLFSGVSNNSLHAKTLTSGIGTLVSGSNSELAVNVNLNYISIPFTGYQVITDVNQYIDLITTTVPKGTWLINAVSTVGNDIDETNIALKVWNGDSGAGHKAWAISQAQAAFAQVSVSLVGIANITNNTGSVVKLSIYVDNFTTVDSTMGYGTSGIGPSGTSGISPTQLVMVRIG